MVKAKGQKCPLALGWHALSEVPSCLLYEIRNAGEWGGLDACSTQDGAPALLSVSTSLLLLPLSLLSSVLSSLSLLFFYFFLCLFILGSHSLTVSLFYFFLTIFLSFPHLWIICVSFFSAN